MYYKIIDNKKEKWIMLLHCICSNMHVFDNYMEKLSKEYNILLIDLPGHGESKNYNKEISFKSTAKKICKIIKTLNIEKLDIWAISLGCIVTKYILEIIPENINKIYFESPAFGLSNKFYLFCFYIFNKVKFILPKKIYLKTFIYLLTPCKKRKQIRNIMYNHLSDANLKTISIWLDKMLEEYLNQNYTILNKSEINKTYILAEKDYVFKGATLKNIKENKYNKIIIKKNLVHLCHLETYNLL